MVHQVVAPLYAAKLVRYGAVCTKQVENWARACQIGKVGEETDNQPHISTLLCQNNAIKGTAGKWRM